MKKLVKGCLGVAAALIAAHFALAEVNAGIFSECSPCGMTQVDPCDPCGPNPCDPCGASGGLFGSRNRTFGQRAVGGWEFGGWVEAGWYGNEYGNKMRYVDGLQDPLSGNTFVLQNVAGSHPQMNQAVFFIGKSLDTRKGFDVGGRFDFMYGTDARFLQSLGLERGGSTPWGTGDYYAAISQAYGEVGVGNFSLKIGKFLSVLNTEFDSPYAVDRFFYSTPYTHFQVTANDICLALGNFSNYDGFNLARQDMNTLIDEILLAPLGGGLPPGVSVTNPETLLAAKMDDFVAANAAVFADDVNNAVVKNEDARNWLAGTPLVSEDGLLPNGQPVNLANLVELMTNGGGGLPPIPNQNEIPEVELEYRKALANEINKAFGTELPVDGIELVTVQDLSDAGADFMGTTLGLPGDIFGDLSLEEIVRLASTVNLVTLSQMGLGIKPHTMSGAIGTWNVNKDLSFFAGWTSGENQTFFNSRDNAFVGGVKYNISQRAKIGYGLMVGKTDNLLGFGIERNYFVQSLYFQTKLGKRWHYNIDWTLRNDSLGYGGATYLRYGAFGLNQELICTLNQQWAIGGRFEWMCLYGAMKEPFAEAIGSYAQSGTLPVFNYTVGANWTPSDWLLIRPEVRWDVIPGVDPFNGGTRNYQCSFGASAVAKF